MADAGGVRFSFDGTAQYSLRSGLVAGTYALTVVPVGVATLLVPHGATLAPRYMVAGILLLGVIVTYVIVKLLRMSQGPVQISPWTVAIMASIATIVVGLAQAADGGPLAVYLDLFLVTTVFAAVVGDITMRLSGLAVTTAAVAWSSWEVGIRSWTYVTLLVMMTSVCGAASFMVAHSVADLIGIGRSRRQVDELTVLGTKAETIEEGLATCLPAVDQVLHARRVVAFLDREGSGKYAPVVAWPEPSGDDADLVRLQGFDEATSTRHRVVQREHCFIPIGKTLSGNLVIVVVRRSGRARSLAEVTEVANALTGSFLRMSGRVAFVDQLRRESMVDPLTGLPNRRTLYGRLELEIELSVRTGTPMCVAMVDLDHFKEFNDSYGHLAGDEMLRFVSATMATACRRQDLLARFGGEEFCFVLTAMGLEGAAAVMEVVRGLPYRVRDRPPLTVSIGVAERVDGDDVASLIGRADRALYSAKRAGRNQVILATDASSGRVEPGDDVEEGQSR